MTVTTGRDQPPDQLPIHEALGVGCRLSLAAMTDDFADVILGALADADASDVEVETDDVSTYVAGPEPALLRYLREVVVAAAARAPGVHLSATILLSRGCPGEARCELPADGGPASDAAIELPASGVRAAAHWSLYPLGANGHLPAIERAIEVARRDGTYVRSEHYATRLEGDVADVLATVANGWLEVGRHVQHVASHVTLSIASPTPGGEA